MITLWLLLIPAAGAILALMAGTVSSRAPRAIASLALALDAILIVTLWANHSGGEAGSLWWVQWSADWIPQLGIRFSLGLDGLSMLLALMACVTSLAALVGSSGDRRDEGLHSALFLATVTGVLGVFLATDLMLFFVFYEVMLLPAYALIVRWGSGNRSRAAMRFFVFTQTGGLLMLISILGLHVSYLNLTGVHTFDYAIFREMEMSGPLATLFLLGFVLAFAVKLPVVPFHTWQPEAYASARTETAVLLSALMSKTAGYGLLRFAIPLFPEAAAQIAPTAIAFGVLTILYASWVAYGQRDMKRVIAYSSAGHLGYVLLGAFAMNDLARSGAILQMVCHGLSVTGMFLIAGHLERSTGTRDLDQLGGLWKVAPRFGGISAVFVLATLGLPGLGNFIGEFLVLVGVFQAYPAAGAVAAVGAVLGAAYSLRFLQRVFFGSRTSAVNVSELAAPALVVCAALIAALIWIGVRPQVLLRTLSAPVQVSEVAAGEPR